MDLFWLNITNHFKLLSEYFMEALFIATGGFDKLMHLVFHSPYKELLVSEQCLTEM
jgi:hypothetical protein